MNQNDQIFKIFSKAKELFYLDGVRNITMQEIAKSLGISKKTIYFHFENKADLVCQSVKYDIEMMEKHILELIKSADNSIIEMQLIGNFVSKSIEKFKPNRIVELEKYYPTAFDYIDKHRKTFVTNIISKNIERGIFEKLYRPEIEIEKTTLIYLLSTSALFDQKSFTIENHSVSELYSSFLAYHIQSIISEKGKIEYNKSKYN